MVLWLVIVFGLAVLAFTATDRRKTHYFVTVVERSFDNTATKETRCFGYTDNFKAAEEAILSNIGDIHEETNQYAVIEEMVMGVCSQAARFTKDGGVWQWYVWEGGKEGRYVRCGVPDWAVNVCNWGIG